jgi:hypothetical protein
MVGLVLAIVLPVAAAGTVKSPPDWISGMGMSMQADPAKAGEEAAKEAFGELNGKTAKLVIVFAAEPQVTPELVAGIAKVFPKELIYGCQVTSPLIKESNFADSPSLDIPIGLTVWALGGDMELAISQAKTDPDGDDSYFDAGFAIGEELKPAIEASKKAGKVILTFGDQFNGSNKDFASGLNSGLDAIYPIIGGAAGNTTAKVIAAGVIETGLNVAILIADDFRLGLSSNGGTHSPETTEKTILEALAPGDGAEPFFTFVVSCRRRRMGMIENNQLPQELEVIKKHLPGLDFFGFYGPGEVGAVKNGDEAKGMGFTVTMATFFAL